MRYATQDDSRHRTTNDTRRRTPMTSVVVFDYGFGNVRSWFVHWLISTLT